MEHPKLSLPKQIENLKKKGVTFEICNESDARRFLENHNYYYKLKAYTHNYDKYKDEDRKGQYINLDFAYLVDLSTIDSRLRKVVLNMTLDLEHFLRVNMLSHFNKVDEDGYEIIDQLFEMHPEYKDEIEKKYNTSTCRGIIEKYGEHWAIWSVVELMSFGQFIELYKLFYSRNAFREVSVDLLFPVKMIRNAAAHNNCLINQMRSPYSREINPTFEIKRKVGQLMPQKSKGVIERKLKHPTVHDFAALMLLYFEIVPEPTRSRGFKEVKELFEQRMRRHGDYYQKEQVLLSNYEFCCSIINSIWDKLPVDI